MDHDRAGKRALVIELTAACDLAGATQMTSEQRAERYRRVDRTAPEFSAARLYDFPGGCITVALTVPAASRQQLTTESLGVRVRLPPGVAPGAQPALRWAAAGRPRAATMSRPSARRRWAQSG